MSPTIRGRKSVIEQPNENGKILQNLSSEKTSATGSQISQEGSPMQEKDTVTKSSIIVSSDLNKKINFDLCEPQ